VTVVSSLTSDEDPPTMSRTGSSSTTNRAAFSSPVGERRGPQLQLDGLRLPGLEKDALEPPQLLPRAHDLRPLVPDVEVHDLVARPRPVLFTFTLNVISPSGPRRGALVFRPA
jgi:hypothetical protein